MQVVRESPVYVQTSLAGAICLGLEAGRFMPQTRCTCLNLLLTYDSGCRASCSYCGLAHNRQADSGKTFIRVKWPCYSIDEILQRMRTHRHPFKRVCVSMVTHGRALDDTCAIVRQVRENTDLPVSGLLAPTVMKGPEDMRKLKDAGVDRIGIAIDAANEELFDKHRGSGVGGPHRWERFWESVGEGVAVFGPYMAGVHLIVGLGESEKEMVQTINRAYRLGAMTHLFSFFPESGSLLQGSPQPPLGQYRRVQLARYLINGGYLDMEQIKFSPEGRILDYGLDIAPHIQKGEAFMTSGCPDKDGKVACNRPFGNERASEPMRNYPYPPGREDVKVIASQIWDGVEQYG